MKLTVQQARYEMEPAGNRYRFPEGAITAAGPALAGDVITNVTVELYGGDGGSTAGWLSVTAFNADNLNLSWYFYLDPEAGDSWAGPGVPMPEWLEDLALEAGRALQWTGEHRARLRQLGTAAHRRRIRSGLLGDGKQEWAIQGGALDGTVIVAKFAEDAETFPVLHFPDGPGGPVTRYECHIDRDTHTLVAGEGVVQ